MLSLCLVQWLSSGTSEDVADSSEALAYGEVVEGIPRARSSIVVKCLSPSEAVSQCMVLQKNHCWQCCEVKGEPG